MKHRMILFFALLLCLALLGCTAQPTPEPTAPQTTGQAAAPESFDLAVIRQEIDSRAVADFVPAEGVTDYVLITVTDFGQIVVRLRPDVAPISTENFQKLVQAHYYDGSSFHRVFPGFMIQGGMGKKEVSPIKGEFAANGVENPLLHLRGILSMARATEMDSATSQFFLMHADNDSLDGRYAAFGYVVAGLDTVDRICQIDLGINPYNGEQSVPLVDVIIESAVFAAPKQ